MKKTEKFRIIVDEEGAAEYAKTNMHSKWQDIIGEYVQNSIGAGAKDIRIELRRDSIKILDNGIGMSPKIMKERFTRVHDSQLNLISFEPGKYRIGAKCGLSIAKIMTVNTKCYKGNEIKLLWHSNDMLNAELGEPENKKIKGTSGTLLSLTGLTCSLKDIEAFVNEMQSEIQYFKNNGKMHLKTVGFNPEFNDEILPRPFSSDGVVCDTIFDTVNSDGDGYIDMTKDITLTAKGINFSKVIKGRKNYMSDGYVKVRVQMTETRQNPGIMFSVCGNRIYKDNIWKFLGGGATAGGFTKAHTFNPLVKISILAESTILKHMLSENKVALSELGELDGVKFEKVYETLRAWFQEIIKCLHDVFMQWSRKDEVEFVKPSLLQEIEETLEIGYRRTLRGEGDGGIPPQKTHTMWKCHDCGVAWRVQVGIIPTFCGEHAEFGDEDNFCKKKNITPYTFVKNPNPNLPMQQGSGKFLIGFTTVSETKEPASIIGSRINFWVEHPRMLECANYKEGEQRDAAVKSYIIDESITQISKSHSEMSGSDFFDIRNGFMYRRPKSDRGQHYVAKHIKKLKDREIVVETKAE